MSEKFTWDKHLSSDSAEGEKAKPAAPPSGAQPPAGGAPPAPQSEGATGGGPSGAQPPAGNQPPMPNQPPAPTPAAQPMSDPSGLPEIPAGMDAPIDFKRVELNDEQYVPAHVPEELRSPVAAESKFKDVIDGGNAYHQVEASAPTVKEIHMDELLKLAVQRKASDFHLTAGLPPMIRLDGELVPLAYQPLNPNDIQRLVYEILSDDNITKFESTHELDCSYTVKDVARFRMNIFMQRSAMAAALRLIPSRIPSFDELGLPGVIRDMSKRTSGLILVTGPTGSGKSTTIASMLDDINETRHDHILTIEDPIEYLHPHKRCMVNQREMHTDTFSFHASLRAVLREDPDNILVGELRDLETIEAALTLAETGHLVFGTLHTRNAPSTIDRIIDVFPSDQQDQIRVLLGNTLEAVVSQQLLPKIGSGRVAALEIMLGLPSIRNLIREGKTHQMYSVIETSQNHGMVTMDRSLADLYKNGVVSYDECLMRAVDKDSFARLAKGVA